jgi:putative ABC transport system permease protein
MVREIRFAFRRLVRSPGFVVIAVVTLALAIGASSAVLSLVNALLIRPLPYRAPQQLVLLLQHFKSQNLERIPVSPPEFVDYESRGQDFEKMGAFGNVDFNLVSGDKPERIAGAQVTANVFPLLGVTPIKGRFFEPTECQVGRDDVIIISERVWQRKLPAQRAVRADPMIALQPQYLINMIRLPSIERSYPLGHGRVFYVLRYRP